MTKLMVSSTLERAVTEGIIDHPVEQWIIQDLNEFDISSHSSPSQKDIPYRGNGNEAISAGVSHSSATRSQMININRALFETEQENDKAGKMGDVHSELRGNDCVYAVPVSLGTDNQLDGKH